MFSRGANKHVLILFATGHKVEVKQTLYRPGQAPEAAED